MDLLKNLMFKQANIENFENINTQWKELNDAIQSANEKPFSFLRYFIFSNFDVKRDDVQEEKVYEWFLNNNSVCQYTEKPIEFVEKLRKSANAYASFIKGKNTDGTNNCYLANIKHLTPNSRQHMSLLLTGLELPKELFIELCRQLENTLFALIITGKKLNELERTFIEWSSEIRKVKDADTLHQFVNQYILPIKRDLRQKFEEIFLSLQEKDLPKYRLKYMLAKLSQYINEKAFGSEENWINLNTFIQNKIEIEHILPQKPEQAIVEDFDKPNEITKYISRLGNLTLLEKTINASIGRGTFSEKKAAYPQSIFLLTRSITEKPVLGTNTAINRAVQDPKEFTIWNSQAIEERQKMLTDLAKQVWDMDQAV
ncbi:HNH endonuclease family protein [Nostoc sp. DedSLP04]|uniref:HNH endonuclease family protein n=1 Tax=Nostoc sp. DedSLP04 TaxID=3075401 RepID=UPI002AD4B4D2|nr:HNH endonuclease family protein [Nostoc sp. DedSLP04]MDZ8029539.1 HNH endonuclease family protein [Nostoc sp. DedSLP04]